MALIVAAAGSIGGTRCHCSNANAAAVVGVRCHKCDLSCTFYTRGDSEVITITMLKVYCVGVVKRRKLMHARKMLCVRMTSVEISGRRMT